MRDPARLENLYVAPARRRLLLVSFKNER